MHRNSMPARKAIGISSSSLPRQGVVALTNWASHAIVYIPLICFKAFSLCAVGQVRHGYDGVHGAQMDLGDLVAYLRLERGALLQRSHFVQEFQARIDFLRD